jgi:hypothetical protein
MAFELTVIALVVLVVMLLVLRFARLNNIERSIDQHKRQLGTIEEVVHRTSERNARAKQRPTPLRDSEEEQRGAAQQRKFPEKRVTVANNETQNVSAPSTQTPDIQRSNVPKPTAQFPVDQSPDIELADKPVIEHQSPRVSPEGRLVFGDLSLTPVKPPTPPIYASNPHRQRRTRVQGQHMRERSGGRSSRHVLVVGVSVVTAVVAGGIFYATNRHPAQHPAQSLAPTKPKVHHPAAAPTPKPATTSIKLLSSTPTSSTFSEPTGGYLVVVKVAEACWLGFEHQPSASGPWFAMTTIGESGRSSYSTEAHGPLAIDVGAPSSIKSIDVNGHSIDLPPLPTHAYEVIFA